MKWRVKFQVRYLVAFIAILAIASASAAASGAPSSMQEAEASGSPLADAPAINASDIYVYEGDRISEEEADSENLSCVQSTTKNRCFDDIYEAEAELNTGSPAADLAGKPRQQASYMRRLRAGRALATRAGDCFFGLLWEWKDINLTGDHFSLTSFGVFANYSAPNDQTTTSFATGEGKGIFAGHQGGGGEWYPGSGTGYCQTQPNLRPTGWNNRFRSRLRYN